MNPKHRSILIVLAASGSATTLTIQQEMSKLNFWWGLCPIYDDLWQLEDQGYIGSFMDETIVTERKGMRRKFYYLTQVGRMTIV